LISIDSILKSLTSKTKAIIPVNLNGRATRLPQIIALAKEYGLKVIEDNAQGLGAIIDGKQAGTFGDLASLSFFPAKTLGCLGDGGAILTQSQEFSSELFKLRNHGRSRGSTLVERWGVNSRLDNIQAAVLSAKLSHLDAFINRRREIASTYTQGLSSVSEIKLPPFSVSSSTRHDTFQNYEIEAERRDDLKKYLQDKGVETSLPWAGRAVHQMSLEGVLVGDVQHTTSLFERVLLLPMNHYLKNNEVEYVIESISKYYSGK